MKKILLFIIMLSASLAHGQVPTTGLIGEYMFTSGSLNDTGGSNNLTQTGSALTSTINRAGGDNRAINLNGDYLRRGTFAVEHLSMSFWIKSTTNDATKRTIIDQSQRTADAESQAQYGWYAYLQNGKVGVAANFHYRYQVGGTVYEGNQGYSSALGTTVITDGEWHHVAITLYTRIYYWQNSNWLFENTYSVYVDGALAGSIMPYRHSHVGSSVLSSSMFPNEAVTIGNNKSASLANRFTESIDDLRFYNVVLNSTQVGQLNSETTCGGSTAVTAVAQDLTVQLNVNGTVSVGAASVNNGSENSCGDPATVSLDITSFTCENVGNNTVTLTAQDEDGNTSTATATIHVRPYIHTQASTVYLDASGNGTLTIAQVETGNSSQCEAITYSLSKSAFTCDDLGYNDVLYIASYGDGLTHQSHAYVTVVSSLTASAQNLEVQLSSSGSVTVPPASLNNGSSISCPDGELSFSLSKSTFTCEDIGENTVNFTVADGEGNEESTEVVITVTSFLTDESVTTESNEFCPDGSSEATISTSGSIIGINYYLRKSNDNSVVDGPKIGTGNALDFSTGALIETTTFNIYAEADLSSEEDNYTLNFDGTDDHVSASIDPAFEYQNGYTLEALVKSPLTSSTKHYPIFHVGTATTSDIEVYLQNTTNKLIVLHNRRASGGITHNEYPTPPANTWYHLSVTYDGATIKVFYNGIEKTPIGGGTAGGLLTKTTGAVLKIGYVQNATGWGSALRNFAGEIDEVRIWNVAKTSAEILENVNSCLTKTELNLVSYYKFDEGIASTATDVIGGFDGTLVNMDPNTDWELSDNTLECDRGICSLQMSTEVTIGDRTPPSVISQNLTIQLDAQGNAEIAGADLNNGSSDECSSTLTYTLDKTSFTCDDLGVNTVVLTVSDESSNESTAEATVTVQDNMPPAAVAKNITLALDQNGNGSIGAADINDGSSDNCTATESLVLSLDKTEFTCDNLGANTVVLTVSDGAGNESTVNAIVTVIDEISPIAIVQDFTLSLDASGQALLLAGNLDNGSSDNCTSATGLLKSASQTAFSCDDLGQNVITFTVTDQSGNQSDATATVTVVDAIAPTAIAQDISVRLDINNQASITGADVDNGSSDNCSSLIFSLDKSTFDETDLGPNQVTLTMEDASGNTSTANASVTVLEYKLQQTITFASMTNLTYGDAPITLTASASSSLDVAFSLVSGPATLTGNVLTITGAGLISLQASQSGNDDYLPAEDVLQSFTVDKAALQVVADSKETPYGNPIPELTFSYIGLVNGDDTSVLDTEPTIATSAGNQGGFAPAGSFEITLSGGVAANYDFQFTHAMLTVSKANLTATADNQSIVFGDALPTLTFSYQGFAQGENELSLTSTPSVSTTATATSDAGEYAIELSGGEAANYTFTLNSGTLTIAKATAQIIISDLMHIEDGSSKAPSVVTIPADLNFTITYAGSTQPPVQVGQYGVQVVIAETNWMGTAEATMSISPAPLSTEELTHEVTVYPNPSTDLINIQMDSQVEVKIVLYNHKGTQVLQDILQGSAHQIDITSLPAGMYLLFIHGQEQTLWQKIAVIR